MKKYFTPILILLLAVAGLYYLYDESDRALVGAKQSFDSVRTQVDALRAGREATSAQIVELNRSVQDSGEFLKEWVAHYNQTKDFYDSIITQVADKTNCAVIERKWNSDPVTLKVGKTDFEATRFEGTVMGDYRNIVAFIGELETRLQLSAIWKTEFKVGISGVVCSVEVYMPNLALEGVLQ